jgi:NRAMP (natural resistance-associated macrophage protein)-like metal ion transporter
VAVLRRSGLGRLLPLLGVVGPGLITAAADNDPGGITTYSVVGAQFGYSFLWVLLIVTLALAVTQEMGARSGIVTGKGLASLIRERFGVRWTALALLGTLVANLGTTVMEFAGIAAGLELFGLTRYLSVPVAAVLVFILVTRGNYKKVERIFLVLSVVYLSYIASGLLAGPDWSAALEGAIVPSFRFDDSAFVFAFIATVGTTITPWGQFFIQSYVVDKRLSPNQLNHERADIYIGSVFMCVVAGFIIIACAATLFVSGQEVSDATDAAVALGPLAGRFAEILFGLGLLNAGLLSAAILPMSSAYILCEGLGFEAGIDRPIGEARWFYGLLAFFIVFGAGFVLLNLSLVTIALVSQTINAIFLTPILIFLLKLTNDEEVMDKYTNGPVFKIIAGATIVFLIMLSVLLLVTTFLS